MKWKDFTLHDCYFCLLECKLSEGRFFSALAHNECLWNYYISNYLQYFQFSFLSHFSSSIYLRHEILFSVLLFFLFHSLRVYISKILPVFSLSLVYILENKCHEGKTSVTLVSLRSQEIPGYRATE